PAAVMDWLAPCPMPYCGEQPACSPVAQAAYCEPVPPPTCPPTLRIVTDQAGDTLEGGTGDAQTHCKKRELTMPGGGTVKLRAAGGRVKLVGERVQASAEYVKACADGTVLLSGHVRLKCRRGSTCDLLRADQAQVSVKDGEVRVKLDLFPPGT